MLSKRIKSVLFAICLIPLFAATQEVEVYPPEHFIARKYIDSKGREVAQINVPGRKPFHFRMPAVQLTESAVLLNNVPAYDWSFGCSATSAAMMAGYYDNGDYPNIYTGPANNGVAPLNNSVWGTATINGEDRSLCPLSATRQGLDGRTSDGHVDDYWIMSGNNNPDPYVTGGWTPHTYGECTGDYMKTNQSAYGNSDGSTSYTFFTNGSPYGEINEYDGNYGLKLFFESRGCTVRNYYTQLIYSELIPLGFTFGQYMELIDMGIPVLIQVSGHTMLGVGYNPSGNKVLLHDTWDYNLHEMTWGGDYAGLQQWGVSVVELPCSPFAALNEVFSASGIPPCWDQAVSGGVTSRRWSISASNNSGGAPNEMKADWNSEIGTSRLISPPVNTGGIGSLQLSFLTFYDDWGPGATLKIQSSADLINWTDEGWSYASGSGNIAAGTPVIVPVTHNLGGTTYLGWVIVGDHYQFDAWFIDNVSVAFSPIKHLEVNLLPEGLFDIETNMLKKARNATGNQFGGNIADIIGIELHESMAPYAKAGSTYQTDLTTAGQAIIDLPAGLTGSYYIVVKHRNSIETWSSAPVLFGGDLVSYNFTDAAGKAYGNNLKHLDSKYCLFAGEANSDGFINSVDLSSIQTSVHLFEKGYLVVDMNGDGVVDGLDLIMADNNAAAFVEVLKP